MKTISCSLNRLPAQARIYFLPLCKRQPIHQLPAATHRPVQKHRCRLTIGTDSYASNHQLSVLAELYTIQQAFPHIPLPELLQWATRNGALALELDQQLGSFEKGKQPGVVLISDVVEGTLTERSKAVRVV